MESYFFCLSEFYFFFQKCNLFRNRPFIKMREAVVLRCSVKTKVFSEISQNSQQNTCTRDSFLIKLQACNFNKKESLVQVFSCEFCKISKNTFSKRTPPVAAIKTDLKTGVFLWLFQKFLRTVFFIQHFSWLLLEHSRNCETSSVYYLYYSKESCQTSHKWGYLERERTGHSFQYFNIPLKKKHLRIKIR